MPPVLNTKQLHMDTPMCKDIIEDGSRMTRCRDGVAPEGTAHNDSTAVDHSHHTGSGDITHTDADQEATDAAPNVVISPQISAPHPAQNPHVFNSKLSHGPHGKLSRAQTFPAPHQNRFTFHRPGKTDSDTLILYFVHKRATGMDRGDETSTVRRQNLNCTGGGLDKAQANASRYSHSNGPVSCSNTSHVPQRPIPVTVAAGDVNSGSDSFLSPDEHSVDVYLSAASHLGSDEDLVQEAVSGVLAMPQNASASGVDETGHDNSVDEVCKDVGMDEVRSDETGKDEVEGLPSHSSNSSTLSPGSAGAPEVVVDPPSSSSSSTRPSHLGAIPNTFKSTTDSLSPSYRPRKNKKEVAVEAMRVLDSFLKRSLSQNDASPLMHEYQAIVEMERIEEDGVQDTDASHRQPDRPVRQDSIPEYDEEVSHSPVSKTNSVYSSSSLSSSFKHRIRALSKKDVDEAFKKKEVQQVRKKHAVRRRRVSSSSSSSTTTDEEVKERRRERRKRKSLFKKAKEKLRQSFKQRHVGRMESRKGDRSATQSPEGEVLGEVHTHTRTHIHAELHPDPSHTNSAIVLKSKTSHTTRDEKYPKRGDKHTETTVTKKESFPIQDKDQKEHKTLFDSLLHYIRSGKAKITKKRPSSKRLKKAHSVEDVHGGGAHIVDTYERDVTIGDHRQVTHQFQAQVGGSELDEDCADGPGRLTGRPLNLRGLLKFRPAVDVEEERDETWFLLDGASGKTELPYEIHESRHVRPGHVNEDGLDDVDNFQLPSFLQALVDKPHLERSNSERETIYEKVADQLAAIADNYDFKSPLSPQRAKLQSSPPSDVVEPVVQPSKAEAEVQKEAEKELGHYLREKGDKMAKEMPQLNPIVSDLVRNVSYSHFQTVLHHQMRGENSWQQVALMFQVIKQAVHAVGYGTAMAMQLKEMSLRYFEDRFADWVIGQGGWESMVEETDLSSEVD